MERTSNKWTRRELAFVMDNYEGMSDASMGVLMGRTAKATEGKRLSLGLYRGAQRDMSSALSKWHEEHALQTAREFMAWLGDAPNYERIAHTQKRINEAVTCLLSLYANGPTDTGWNEEDDRAERKLRTMVRQLKDARDAMYFEGSRINEAIAA